MRFSSTQGLAALAFITLAAVACNDGAKRAINAPSQTSQPAFNDPQPRPPNDPIANDRNQPQKPILGTGGPQESTLPTHPSQDPVPSHDPQKPFYGPGLIPTPDEKAKAAPLNDKQIVAVALAANNGEVQMAEMAKKKATNPEVKQFAAMMHTHHSQGVQKAKALENKSKLSQEDNDLSQKLKGDVSTTLSDLRDKDGREFDKAYMESQVKAHKEVLQAIDDRLVPNAQNAELKTLLTEMRRQVADHLAKAQDIQAKLEKQPGAASTPTNGSTPGMKGKGNADTKGDIKP